MRDGILYYYNIKGMSAVSVLNMKVMVAGSPQINCWNNLFDLYLDCLP